MDNSFLIDESVRRVKRTVVRKVDFRDLCVVMVAAAAGWAAGGSEVKSVNRGPCA